MAYIEWGWNNDQGGYVVSCARSCLPSLQTTVRAILRVTAVARLFGKCQVVCRTYTQNTEVGVVGRVGDPACRAHALDVQLYVYVRLVRGCCC